MKKFLIFFVLMPGLMAHAYTTQEGLQLAWLDETHNLKIYEGVIKKFGEVMPFSNIVKAEQRHKNALEGVAEQLGISLNKNDEFIAPVFESVKEACVASAKAEIDNAALYDEMIAAEKNESVLNVYKHLRDASLLRHLPAFRRMCQ